MRQSYERRGHLEFVVHPVSSTTSPPTTAFPTASTGDLWAGTDLVWRTLDDGRRWSDVTPPGLRPWSKVAGIEPSHFDRQTAYVAVDRHRLDDFAPYVWRTRDGGKSWTAIVSGLADGGVLNTVNVVREDPGVRGLLFAGTERGVFVSFDDGGRWAPLQSGLPTTSVRDINIHGDDLVIATHGRGFWILDHIAALRQLALNPRPGPRLFPPALAIRERPAGFTGTPKPKDEPMAADPPFGAYIDYVLKSDARGPVVIEVRDAVGALVRSYSSADQPPPPDLAHLPIAPEWLPKHEAPSALAGGHRLVWDLRREGSRGISASAGFVDGQRFSQPLSVGPDPRVKAGPDSYGEEFRLARAIEADRGRTGGDRKDHQGVGRDERGVGWARASRARPGLAARGRQPCGPGGAAWTAPTVEAALTALKADLAAAAGPATGVMRRRRAATSGEETRSLSSGARAKGCPGRQEATRSRWAP